MLGASDRSRRYDEWRRCLTWLETVDYLAACPDYGGMRNLTGARE